MTLKSFLSFYFIYIAFFIKVSYNRNKFAKEIHMSALYKVKTTHTKQVLKDFIKFTYKVKNPKASLRLYTLSGCFFVIAATFKDFKAAMLISAAIGIFIFLFTLFRHKIALFRLKRNDQTYKQQSEILFSFDMGGFIIETNGVSTGEKIKYSKITSFYRDTRNYYIGVNDAELHVLPYSDFKLGNVKDFTAFIKSKTGKEVMELKIPLKEQIQRMQRAIKLSEEQHDQQIAEKRKKN
ncbi:MAG TPA: hypothetical protein DIW07_06770 [Lachnospiraceae bacterium]|nr:hypothetical protein [Lachnospiraceae bacterium]